jgi:hypothetical protein
MVAACKHLAHTVRLAEPEFGQGRVGATLPSTLRIPLALAVPNEQECDLRPGHPGRH